MRKTEEVCLLCILWAIHWTTIGSNCFCNRMIWVYLFAYLIGGKTWLHNGIKPFLSSDEGQSIRNCWYCQYKKSFGGSSLSSWFGIFLPDRPKMACFPEQHIWSDTGYYLNHSWFHDARHFYHRTPKTEVRTLFSKFCTAHILFWEYLGVICFRPKNKSFL